MSGPEVITRPPITAPATGDALFIYTAPKKLYKDTRSYQRNPFRSALP